MCLFADGLPRFHVIHSACIVKYLIIHRYTLRPNLTHNILHRWVFTLKYFDDDTVWRDICVNMVYIRFEP